MKFILVFLIFTSIFAGLLAKKYECKNEGCYEVIKTFAELLEKKINESNAILAEAERQLNDITYGNDEDFKEKIREVDEKLTRLLVDVTTGVDGGDKSLTDLINSVFDDVREIEYLTDESKNLAESAGKNTESTKKTAKTIQELVREIQDELNRLNNATTVEGPEELQNAFDRSEKFDSNSKELKDVLGQVKAIVKDYEVNLLNAKMLTASAVEKFAKVESQVNETLAAEKEVDEKLKSDFGMGLTKEELANIKQLAKDVLFKANEVYDEAFNLLDEVTAFELEDKLAAINEKVKKLDETADVTNINLQKLAEENGKFLDEMETTIEVAEKAEKKASEIQAEIEALLVEINAIHEQAKKAILDESSIINDAKKIHENLQGFQMKVEESRENARRALEKIPKILAKVNESVGIVEKLENKLDEQTKAVNDAKDKCTTAKNQMDDILKQTEEIKEKIKQLESEVEPLPDENIKVTKDSNGISDKIDALEKAEAEDAELIKKTQVKIEETKGKVGDIDAKVGNALKTMAELVEEIAKLKDFDESALKDVEKKLLEAEKELDESGLDAKILELKAQQHNRQMLMKKYLEEIAELEYQISVIKKNEEAMENKCFRRTRLEP